MDIMQELKRFVDAQCAIALELKNMNDWLRKQPTAATAAPAPLVVLPDPEEHEAEKKRLRARLTELGIPVPARVRIERLRELLEEAEKKPAVAAVPVDDVFAAPKDDDVFAAEPIVTRPPTLEIPQYTVDQVRAVVVNAIDKFTAKETGEPQQAREKGAAKARAIVLKHMGTITASQWPVEKYGVLVMAVNAAVEALG